MLKESHHLYTMMTKTRFEYFNTSVMKQLLANQKTVSKQLRQSSTQDVNYDPFLVLQKFQDRSEKLKGELSRVKVDYSRTETNPEGRYFANDGSYQNMTRELRGTLANDIYYDFDCVNCHPVILSYVCKERDIPCPNIDKYVKNREKFIKSVMRTNHKLTRDDVKMSVLKVIYGGNVNISSKQFKSLQGEVKGILSQVEVLFPTHYALAKKKDYNVEGSTLSYALQEYEAEIITTIESCLEGSALVKSSDCFDGVMVLKRNIENVAEFIEEAETRIEDVFPGMNMQIKSKPMDVIDFDDLDDSEDDDEDEICDDKLSDYTADNNYYWDTFISELQSIVHPTFDALEKTFKRNINRVLIRTHEGAYLRKFSPDNLVQISTLKQFDEYFFKYKQVKWEGKKKRTSKELIKSYKMSQFFNSAAKMDVDMYNELTFDPKLAPGGGGYNNKTYNTWSGFAAKLLPKEEIDMDLIAPINDLINVVWCNRDAGNFEYICTWFQHIFRGLGQTKTAIVITSPVQQIGKGILVNEFLIPFVFGRAIASSVSGIDRLTSQFNAHRINTVFTNVDELQSLQGSSFHGKFDMLKKIITDPTQTIEVKGGRTFSYPNHDNLLMFSNHTFTLNIEKHDQRYVVLEGNAEYQGRSELFSKLVAGFGPEQANHWFSYIYHLETSRSLRDLPDTKIKRMIQEQSMSKPLKFLKFIKDSRAMVADYKAADDSDDIAPTPLELAVSSMNLVSGRQLTSWFNEWLGKPTGMTNTAFGNAVKMYITKRRSNGVKYNLDSITI